jgi:hypothetical protein
MSPAEKKQKTEEAEEYVPKNILLTGGAGTSMSRVEDGEACRTDDKSQTHSRLI